MNNLKQIGLAIRMYCEDWDGFYPFDPYNGANWVNTISLYTNTKEILYCPSARPHDPTPGWEGDYFINYRFYDRDGGGPSMARPKDSQVRDPVNTIILGDGAGVWASAVE